MCDPPKIHIFLGAPPASSGPGLELTAMLEEEEHPSTKWRNLELTWKDGHLNPATDETGIQEFLSSPEEILGRRILGADQSMPTLKGKDVEPNTVQRDQCSQADCTTEKKRCKDRIESVSDPLRDNQSSASIHEYLESCFPAAQTEPEAGEPQSPLCSKHLSCSALGPLSTHSHYLSTWTLSQALVLRRRNSIQTASSPEKTQPCQTPHKHTQTPPSASSSTPELFSPTVSSLGASAELFSQTCPTLRAQEGGVVFDVTTEGVLCSQEEEQQVSRSPPSSPSKSSVFKKARVDENVRTAETSVPAVKRQTTLLICCNTHGQQYSVLVAVVHPCHLKEVKVKSGPAAGASIPLASIVVTDQSEVEMKVVLWRRAAFWVLTVTPGDILLITGLQLNEDRWRGEMVLQSTFRSKLLNLGQVTASASPPAPRHVSPCSLNSLCGFLQERRPLLVSSKLCPPQDLNRLPYATLRSLRVNTLVHALLRVTQTNMTTAWRSEAESRCRSAVQLKAVLTVEQPDGHYGTLLLWGAAVDWLPRINSNRGAIWDFNVLLVREGLTSDLFELHSTPWSSLRPANQRGQDFFKSQAKMKRDSNPELDLDTLLSQKYSGEVELRVQIISFKFQDSPPSQNAPMPVLDSSTSLEDILEALCSDITYTGCGCCSAELDTDANGIYNPCYPCLPSTSVRCYYRPGVLKVSGQGSSQAFVQVPPVPLQKVLDAPPDKLQKTSAPGSEMTNIRVAAKRIQTILSLPKKTFIITIRSYFLCDETASPSVRTSHFWTFFFTADRHMENICM